MNMKRYPETSYIITKQVLISIKNCNCNVFSSTNMQLIYKSVIEKARKKTQICGN